MNVKTWFGTLRTMPTVHAAGRAGETSPRGSRRGPWPGSGAPDELHVRPGTGAGRRPLVERFLRRFSNLGSRRRPSEGLRGASARIGLGRRRAGPETGGEREARPAPAGSPLVEARGVGVRRGGRWLLHDVDVAVARGEVVTLIGPNGAGKTTLVRVLLGLIRPDAGAVRRNGAVSVGYVPQRVHFDPTLPLTVDRLMTLTARRPAEAVAEALAETGVGHLLGMRVSDLSAGELQRVLLARALMRLPSLLVLDEPVQGVDYTGEAELYELIAGIVERRGCGVLLVSHDLHVVMAATDRVVCINRHVCCTGAPQEVVGHDEFQRLFGPRSAVGAAIYRHAHDHRHDLAGEVTGAGRRLRDG